MKIIIPVLLTVLLSAQPAYTETVYVCNGEGEGGSILFSDKPCKSGEGQSLYFPDTYSSGEGLSELEREQLEEIQARENVQNRETVKLTPSEDELDARPQTKAASDTAFDKAACQEAEESLGKWHKIMSLGYLPEQKETMEAELQKRTGIREQTCARKQ